MKRFYEYLQQLKQQTITYLAFCTKLKVLNKSIQYLQSYL